MKLFCAIEVQTYLVIKAFGETVVMDALLFFTNMDEGKKFHNAQ
jgi:hypothetical protein